MPIFNYVAKNQEGRDEIGSLEAKDEHDLARILRDKNFVLISVQNSEEKKIKKAPFINKIRGIFNRVSLVDKLMFTRHLTVMIASGFSLHKGLETLVKQTDNSTFKKIISDLVIRVKRGETFADSLAQYPKVFNDFYVSMVRVGEKGGTLEEVLKILAQYIKKEHEFISKVRGAMVYPTVVLAAMVGIGTLMMVVVMPKITAMFEELKVNLPFTTKIMIAISKFLSEYFYIGIIIVIAIIVFSIKFLKTRKGKHFMGFVLLKLPILNKIVKKMSCARFARSFSSLMESGVTIVESLTISAQTIGNVFYAQALNNAAIEIKKGKKLQESLEQNRNLFPVLVNQMVGVGEETGELSNIMEKLADFYEEEVTSVTDNLASIIEPVLMLILGGIVAFFAISMIQPMYSMMEGI